MGIVINDKLARDTPCKCIKLNGSDLCFSAGVVGALSNEQEKIFCVPNKIMIPTPEGVKERQVEFKDAIHRAKERYKKEGILKWLELVKEELKGVKTAKGEPVMKEKEEEDWLKIHGLSEGETVEFLKKFKYRG